MQVHGFSTLKNPLLAFGLFSGPAAWFVDLNFRYFWVEAKRTELAGYAVAMVCGLVGLAGAWACYAVWKRERSDESPAQRDTRRFIALGGAALNAFLTLLIAAALIPQLMLGLGD
jgi:hypothetical protein